MTNKDNINVLFFSNKSEASNSVILLLKNEDLIKHFKCVCLDDQATRQKVSNLVKEVPAILLVDRPDVLYVADILKWIDCQKYLKTNNTKNEGKKMYYGPLELTQKSDKYTFIEDKQIATNYYDIKKNDDTTLPSSNKFIIHTKEEKDKLDPKNQKALVNKMESIRKTQDIEYKAYNKKKPVDFTKEKAEDNKFIYTGYYTEILEKPITN